jgi:hypothetical protein
MYCNSYTVTRMYRRSLLECKSRETGRAMLHVSNGADDEP